MNGFARRFWLLAAFAGISFAIGCSNGEIRLVKVSGNVSLKDGSPVVYGYINFHPDSSQGNASREICVGTIKSGQYTLLTGVRYGAPVGAYRVSISAAAEIDVKHPYYTKWYAHEKYISPDRSRLVADVVESPEPGRYDFKLDPHPKAKKK